MRATSPPSNRRSLPPADTQRWIPSRKAVVVAAVRNGSLTLDEVRWRYRLSAEEFAQWERSIDHYGIAGLRVTRTKTYRKAGGT